MRYVVRLALSLVITVLGISTLAVAARPPFKQCNGAVYNGESLNCNILITMNRYGNLTVDEDWNRNWYPPASSVTPGPVFDVGQLIGFQNNSGAPVYSLTLSVPPHTNTNGEPTYLCSPTSRPYNAPNVSIINIPDRRARTEGPYIYYMSTADAGYDHSRCDIVFAGGVPKGGSSYFHIGAAVCAPSYACWSVTAKTVVPLVSFQPAIAKGQTAAGNVILYPSPSPVPVTLNLITTTGSGAAAFGAATTMTTSQSTSVQITGVTASSNSSNVEFNAAVTGDIRSRSPFTVVDTSLACTSPVMRGDTTTCQPATAPIGATYSWKFTDAAGNVVTPTKGSGTWQGKVVINGKVDLSIDGIALTPANVVVTNRSLSFLAVPPTQLIANSITCYDGRTYTLPSPPIPDGMLGVSCANLAWSFLTAVVNDGGPNQGYRFVSNVSDSYQGKPTKPQYLVVSDLLDSTSLFYTSQCGNFSNTNTGGFIAGLQLKSNVFNHEAGSVLSHWTEYRDAQNDSTNNIGNVLEPIVGGPASTQPQFDASVQAAGGAAQNRIEAAINVEPCGPKSDTRKDTSQSCKFCGNINFAPYQICGSEPPVPYCQ